MIDAAWTDLVGTLDGDAWTDLGPWMVTHSAEFVGWQIRGSACEIKFLVR